MYRSPVFQRFLLTACSLVLAFPFSIRGYSFDRFTMEIFRHEIAGNTINLHYTLTDPEAYGIREEEPSFGTLDQEEAAEEVSYLEKCRKKLSGYLRWGLNDEDRLTAKILDWWLEGQIL